MACVSETHDSPSKGGGALVQEAGSNQGGGESSTGACGLLRREAAFDTAPVFTGQNLVGQFADIDTAWLAGKVLQRLLPGRRDVQLLGHHIPSTALFAFAMVPSLLG